MSDFDFNDANAQRETGGVIPEGTVALAVMTIRAGGQGPGGFLTNTKAGDKTMIDAEFTLASGKHERRKVWKNMMITPIDSESGQITRAQLRAAIESALAIHPGDMSETAIERRRVPGYQFFDGLTVCMKIGIEKGKDGNPDKNTLRAFVTPDSADYINPGPQQGIGTFQTAGAAVQRAAASAGGGTAAAAKAAAPVSKPAWAS